MNKIPNNVYQTFCCYNLPSEIINIVNHNKKLCSDYNFIFYDDNACQEFIKNNFSEHIFNAFMSINTIYGAMKADFFRYCILYIKGGVYLDIKSIITKPLHTIIQPNDICILDILRDEYEPWRKNNPTYEQWILMFAPNHPYLLEVINTMVSYIHKKYEPTIENIPILNTKQKIIHVTGPDMFSKCIRNYLKNNKPLHRNIDYKDYFKISIFPSHIKMYSINKKLHYSQYNEPLYITL
jgi:mannosyltransferase OCH1-like enzyme